MPNNNNMSEETKNALLECIDKYEHAARIGELPDLGPHNCALCQLFNLSLRGYEGVEQAICEGCPVQEATGQPFCINTPYRAVELATGSEIAVACAAEAEFLKSLLPPEVQ